MKWGRTGLPYAESQGPIRLLYLQQGEEERNQNVPPHWNVYFNVNNADAIWQPKEHIGAGIQG